MGLKIIRDIKVHKAGQSAGKRDRGGPDDDADVFKKHFIDNYEETKQSYETLNSDDKEKFQAIFGEKYWKGWYDNVAVFELETNNFEEADWEEIGDRADEYLAYMAAKEN